MSDISNFCGVENAKRTMQQVVFFCGRQIFCWVQPCSSFLVFFCVFVQCLLLDPWSFVPYFVFFNSAYMFICILSGWCLYQLYVNCVNVMCFWHAVLLVAIFFFFCSRGVCNQCIFVCLLIMHFWWCVDPTQCLLTTGAIILMVGTAKVSVSQAIMMWVLSAYLFLFLFENSTSICKMIFVNTMLF